QAISSLDDRRSLGFERSGGLRAYRHRSARSVESNFYRAIDGATMPIVPILVLVLLVAGAVALYMSGATWRWDNIPRLALVMLVAVGWFYLAARTLKIQTAWRTEVGRWDKAIAAADKQHDEILRGQTDAEGKVHLGLETAKLEVEKVLQGRGRIWSQVA